MNYAEELYNKETLPKFSAIERDLQEGCSIILRGCVIFKYPPVVQFHKLWWEQS